MQADPVRNGSSRVRQNGLGPRPDNRGVGAFSSLSHGRGRPYVQDGHINATESATIEHYRQEVMKVADHLTSCLADFDAQPDEYRLALQLRELRQTLENAIDIFYAAAGVRNPEQIPPAIDVATHVDVRLRSLDEEVQGEVARFEHTADTIASCFHPRLSAGPQGELCADANELLLEVSVYRTGWDMAIQESSRVRLDVVESKLRSILDSSPQARARPTSVSGFPLPGVEADGEFSETSSDDGTYAARLSSGVTKSPSNKAQRGLHLPVNRVSRPPKDISGIERGSSTNDRPRERAGRTVDRVRRRSSVVANSSLSSPKNHKQENGESPSGSVQTMILSRSRTLKDMAASALSSDFGNDDERGATRAAEQMFSEYAKSAADEGPSLLPDDALAPNAPRSFASMLYNTHNARSSPVSDTGKTFQRSVVRGDGRCLFRSVARARTVGRGKPVASERAEREVADDLRQRTVVELKRNRALLQQFYVIETDFENYAKRMSSPRTFGGEPELLMLAKIIHAPIGVYILAQGRYKQIQVYGRQYRGEPIRILYSDGVHYDALLDKTPHLRDRGNLNGFR
jgi:hypothetical protein